MATTHNQRASFTTLPPELILQVIPHIPHDPQDIAALQLTNRHFYDLLTTHETTLVPAIRKCNYQTAPQLFPSLLLNSYPQLATLHSRLATLTALHDNWLHLTSHGPELNWLRDRWESIHKAGTLLLYRLRDCSESFDHGNSDAAHAAKVDLLNLLPATSLACLVFKCYSAIKILRVHGPQPVHATFAKDDAGTRCEVELALEEMLLEHGAEFFVALLEAGRVGGDKGRWAVDALNDELANMEFRQLHSAAPTLISTLRQSFAQKTNGHFANTATKMWEVLSSSVFDEVDEEKMVKIVTGETLVGGMRRMGY
ncbi:hypothetical protein Q7P37_011134 [Cladosporium fusiforme]